MTFLYGLKRLCDISFYMTFASIIVYLSSGDHLILTLPVFILVAFLSSYFTLDGNLRYACAIPLFLTYLIVPLTVVNFLMVTPAIIYMIWAFPKPDEATKRFQYQGFLEIIFIVFIIFLVGKFFFVIYDPSLSSEIPIDTYAFAILFLLISIIFVRLIRYDSNQIRFENKVKAVFAIMMIGALVISGIVGNIRLDFSREDVVADELENSNIPLQEIDGMFLLDLLSLSLQDLEDLTLLDLGDLTLQDLDDLSLLDLEGLTLQDLDDLSLLDLEDLSLQDLEEVLFADLEDLASDLDSPSRPNLSNQSRSNLPDLSLSDLAGPSLTSFDILSLLGLDNLSLQDLGELAVVNLEDLSVLDLKDQVLQTLDNLPLLDLEDLPFPDLEDIPLLNLADLPFLDLENLLLQDLIDLPFFNVDNISFFDLDNLLLFNLVELIDLEVVVPTVVGGSVIAAIALVPIVFAVIAGAFVISLIKSPKKTRPTTIVKDVGFEEERSSLDAEWQPTWLRRRAENQVRTVYQRFLAAVKRNGLRIPPHLTSYDVEVLVAAQFASEKSSELREEYIRVRYGEVNYTKEDVEHIRTLYKEVKSEIEMS